MDPELKRRPLLFDVRPAQQRPPLGVVTTDESEKLQFKHRKLQLQDEDGNENERGTDEDERSSDDPILPAGALPAVFSPRPIKKPYVPTPSDTPKYFRWKPQPMAPLKPPPASQQGKTSPSVMSPSAQRRQSHWKVAVDTRVPSGDNTTPSSPFSRRDTGVNGFAPDDKLSMNESRVAPWQGENASTAELLATPESSNYLFDGPTMPQSGLSTPAIATMPSTPSSSSMPSSPGISCTLSHDNSRLRTPIRPSSKPANAETTLRMQIPTNLQVSGTSIGVIEPHLPLSEAVSRPLLTRFQPLTSNLVPGKTSEPIEQVRLGESTSLSTLSEVCAPPEDEVQSFAAEPEPAKAEAVDDALATPIVIRTAGDKQPEVFTQHVLRGVILRKYLHLSNIARKLRETEQHVLHVTASDGSFWKTPTTASATPGTRSRKSSLERGSIDSVAEDTSGVAGGPTTILRRLASVDKAISQTAQQMRLMSSASIPALTAHNLAKGTSLRTIGEGKQLAQAAQAPPLREKLPRRRPSDMIEDEASVIPVRAKLDPTSAHILRICRHVIAKRTMKSFLRQEMSVITQTEVALRDDAVLQRRPGSSSFSSSCGSDRSSSRPPTIDNRIPIKSMASDLVDSLAAYLKEGDQHLTVDELFLKALVSEAEKQWKRAILLASACVVIDREFILAALLRARCCRRLGLWAQAIKDLTHALLLRPEDQRLFLLRACLHSKTRDTENALADVNRALVLHPQYTEALLLRAEIFHRGRAVSAALQDLTSVLALDRTCWRAYYDRATLRLRAIEGEEQSLVYHSEHLRYEELLAAIIQDYVNALHKGCTLVEVVETVGDLTVRLLEFTGDVTVLRQVIQNLTRLLHLLVHDPSGGLGKPRIPRTSSNTSGLGTGAGAHRSLSTGDRELLVAAIYAQRGRLYVLSNDKVNALEDFDHAVVMEYHYPVAHFYRGAFATLLLVKDSSTRTTKEAETTATHHASNMQHLSRCLSLDPTIAGAYTVRGAIHLSDLRFNNALQDFKVAVATDPTLSEVWLQIALVYLNHYHDSEECIKACTSALTNDAGLSRAIYLRAEAYTRQGNTAAALCDYTRLTRAQPSDRWAHLLRGRLQLTLRMARPALYSFICFMEQVTNDPPSCRQAVRTPADTKTSKDKPRADSKDALLLCGRAFQLLSRFQSAVRAFEQAVAKNPTSENLVLLSESLHSLGDTENSLRMSDKVVNTDPSSFRGYARRAQLLVSVGQLTLAMAEYDRAISLAPREGRMYYERGVVQMQLYLRWRVAFQRNFASNVEVTDVAQRMVHSPFAPRIPARDVERELGADAVKDEPLVRKMIKQFFVGSITDLSKCIRLEPLLADAYVDRAELNALGEEYDRAFRDFETATERQPKYARAYVSLGVLKCQFAAYAAAIEDFDKAIKLETAATAEMRAYAFFNRGVAYQKLELWSQAEKSYTRSIALFGRGRDVDVHRNRAIARCHLGLFDGALEDLEEVEQYAPDDDELHGALGFALLQLNRYEDAAKHFAAYGRLGRDTYVDSGNAYFNLATKSETHVEQTQHAAYLERARRFYLRAARLQPSNVDIRLNLANCLRKESAFRAAITQCDTISREHPLNHVCLESKALALFQLPGQKEEAVACMDAAVRTCVSSSSNLENIFYAFTNGTIHRNALERKTVRRNGTRRLITVTPTSPTDGSGRTSAATTLLAQMETPAPKVHLTGSHEQILALYMLNRGIMLEKMGLLTRARQDYDDALHFDPLSIHVHVCLGTLSLREGNFEQGAAEFQRALELDASSGVAHLNLGVVCLSRNNLPAAVSHFDAAISLLPRCSYAYANKAVALARSGDMAGAELHFKKAIDELPSRKEFYLARGKIVALQKRLHDAMVDFSTALFLGYDGKL